MLDAESFNEVMIDVLEDYGISANVLNDTNSGKPWVSSERFDYKDPDYVGIISRMSPKGGPRDTWQVGTTIYDRGIEMRHGPILHGIEDAARMCLKFHFGMVCKSNKSDDFIR